MDTEHCGTCGQSDQFGLSKWTNISDGVCTKVRCRECESEELRLNYRKTGRINTTLTLDAALNSRRDYHTGEPVERRDGNTLERVNAAMAAINNHVKMFDKRVWFGGLQKLVQKCETKGMSATHSIPTKNIGKVKVLAYAMAGRAMVTLDAKKCSITVITAEDEDRPRMGIQGIDATELQAIELLDSVMDAWVLGEVHMKSDTNIGM